MRLLCLCLVSLGLLARSAAARTHQQGRSLACVDTFAACPGWVGQCASPGVATYCPCMCASGTAPPTVPPPPPSVPPPTTPPPPPTNPGQPSNCPDTNAACPGWVGQCASPGVSTFCPCMCNGGSPTTKCTAQPSTPANANAYTCSLPADTGASCTTSCAAGYTGSPSAACSNSGQWTPSGSCSAAASPKCNSQPQAVPNGNSFSCSLPANAGATCTGTCAVGYTGSQTASCSSNGAWTVSGSCTSSTGSSDTAAGINKDQFTKVFAGDTDKCGSACPGYSSNPNTQTVIDKHWGFFKSAAAARGFRLQSLNEASIFFGNIKHEYGGNLDNMREFCGRQGQVCGGGYGNYYGRGPLQLTWDTNYRYVATVVNVDITNNPDQVADNTRDLSWQTAMIFWTDSNLNCAGMWGSLASLPTCPNAANAGNMATVTRRINPNECSGGPYAASQPARIQQVQTVRSLWGLPALTQTTC